MCRVNACLHVFSLSSNDRKMTFFFLFIISFFLYHTFVCADKHSSSVKNQSLLEKEPNNNVFETIAFGKKWEIYVSQWILIIIVSIVLHSRLMRITLWLLNILLYILNIFCLFHRLYYKIKKPCNGILEYNTEIIGEKGWNTAYKSLTKLI